MEKVGHEGHAVTAYAVAFVAGVAAGQLALLAGLALVWASKPPCRYLRLRHGKVKGTDQLYRGEVLVDVDAAGRVLGVEVLRMED